MAVSHADQHDVRVIWIYHDQERELAVVLFTHNWFRDDDDDVVFADKVQGENRSLAPLLFENGALFLFISWLV